MSNIETQGVETLQVNLSRDHQGVPWGFRLTGGKDFANALSIQLVQPNSVAEQCGLQAGDGVLSVNNIASDELEHEQAKQEIMRSGNQVQFLVQRGGVMIWKPKVTPMSGLKPNEMTLPTGEQVVQRTSLAANKQDVHHIGSAHNRAARPFPGFGQQQAPCAPQQQYSAPPPPPPQQQQQQYQGYDQQQQYQQQQQQQQQQYQPPAYQTPQPREQDGKSVPAMVHAQYNSPMGLYSQTNVSDAYTAQAQGIVSKMTNMNVQDQGPSPTAQAVHGGGAPGRTSGTRTVSAPITRPGAGQKPKEQLNKCGECGMLITGVFLKIKGIPLHAECFKCAQCGKMLKNIGYFNIEGRNYCELHAKQMTRPGYGGYEANVTYN